MNSSKSLFTLTACALVAAAVPAFAANSLTAWTTTITESSTDATGNSLADYAGTYSGNLFEVTGSRNFAGAPTASSTPPAINVYTTDESGNLGSSATVADGTASVSLTNGSESLSTVLWHYFVGTGTGSAYTDSTNFGHTLYVSSSTLQSGNVTINSNFGPQAFGGLIVGASSNAFSLGRDSAIAMQLVGSAEAGCTFVINSDTKLMAGSGFSVLGKHEWTVAEGKTLSFTTHDGTTAGSVTFDSSGSVASTIGISGGGTVSMGTISFANNAAVTVDSGSTLSGVTAISGAGTLTVNGTMSLAGTLTNSATVAFGTGSNLALTGDLKTAYGDDYSAGGYVDKNGTAASDGNGYVGSISVSVISGTGTLSGETGVTVSHSDSSGTLSGTLDASGKVSFGADYRTYHLNSAGETAFDAALFHADTTAVSVASGATLKLENETTVFDSRALSVGGAGTVEINVTGAEQWFNSTVLTGDVSVVKTGNAKATLYAAQSYTGGTTIEGGNVGVGNNSSLGTGKVTFAGEGAQLTAQTGGLTLANAVEIGVSGGTIHTQANTMTLSGSISAEGALTKQGSGTLVLSGTANLGTLNVDAGTVNFTGTSSATTLETVSLANGTSLGVGGTGNTIGTLAISDSAAATVAFNVNTNQNALTISNLSGTGTLNYTSSVNSGYNMVLTLGDSSTTSDGAFSGEINVSGTAGTGGYRRTVLVIADGGIAENAVVNFGSLSSSANTSRYLALGIAAENVTIAGLTSSSSVGTYTRIVSGAVDTTSATGNNNSLNGEFAGDGVVRTLTISTAADSSYAYAGTILGNVNLVKEGAGTQTLNGASASFDGEVSVLAGVLALGNAAAIGGESANTSVTLDGGHLSVAQNVTLNATALTVVLSDAYSESATAAILGEGSLTSGTTVTLDMDLASAVAALAAETTQTTYSYHLFGSETLSQNLGEDAISLSDTLIAAGCTFTFDSASGVVTLSMIPEPSAFGLLAGVGALALVAARRRRKV